MHTHSCHDALTLARHATATRASRYPAGCTLMMRQISCHACDMLGDIPFGGLMLAGTHGCMLHDLCLVPWRVRTPLRLRSRLHMSHAGASRCPPLRL